MTTKTTYKVGDKVRILNAKAIIGGETHWNDGDVVKVTKVEPNLWLERNKTEPSVQEPFLHASELKYIEKVAEQVAKFKVGGKVRIIAEGAAGLPIGTEANVIEVDQNGDVYLDVASRNRANAFYLACKIELVTQKPTKNQRITALEQAQASLEQTVADLQAEVEALKATQKSPTMTVKADVDVAKIAESLAKAFEKHSPNERRKAIIDEAKAFLIEVEREQNDSKVRGKGNAIHRQYLTKTEFIVNADKRTVVAIIRSKFGTTVLSKAIAKCAPDDVFNADIGKAIALGRALGLDVERFEKAVQPTEFAVGQVTHTTRGSFVSTPLKITKIDGDMAYTNPGRFHFFDEIDIVNITDDTEAQY